MKEKMSSQNIEEMVSLDMRKHLIKFVIGSLRNGDLWQGTLRLGSKKGGWVLAQSAAFPLKSLTGEYNGFTLFMMDITHERGVERIRAAKESITMVYESVGQVLHDVMNPMSIAAMSLQNIKGKSIQEIELDVKAMSSACERVKNINTNFQNVFSILGDFYHEE